MLDPDLNLLLHGSTAPLPEQIPLRAGPLTLIFEAGDLRRISLNGRELVRRIYGAIRDRDWGTVPGELSQLVIASESERFQIGYVSEHRDGAIDFVWRASIEGAPDGTLTFEFSGEARTSFERNRIGLCVLHPIRECAGRMAKAHLITGEQIDVQFPELVAVEQPIDGFAELAGLTYEAGDDSQIEMAFEGDVFETEDQRNWIDASYKTYSTRLALARPVAVAKGTSILQRVTIRLQAPGRVQLAPPARRTAPLAESRGEQISTPRCGIGLGAIAGKVSPNALVVLKDLRPAHVRIDLTLTAAGWESRVDAALEALRAIGCGLELALHVGRESGAELARLAARLPEDSSIARVLVFPQDQPATTPDALDMVQSHLIALRPDLGPVGTGSRVDLYQLHLSQVPAADLLCWPMNPHAHASDVTSLAETPPSAGEQVRSVRARHPGVATAITPVTLGPRAASDSSDPHPLYGSLFGAAWTLAAASHIARAGAGSVTFFSDVRQLTWRGVSPLFHVLADYCEWAGGSVVQDSDSENDEKVTSLLVRRPSGAVLLVANLSRHPRTIRIPSAFLARRWRVLDTTTVGRAVDDRHAFRREVRDAHGIETLELGAFATARLDGELRGA